MTTIEELEDLVRPAETRTLAMKDAFSTISNGMNVKQNREGTGLPISRIETISDGRVNRSKCGYAGISGSVAEKWLLNEGDILFSHINSPEQVGKCALVEAQDLPLVHGMNLLRLVPRPEVLDSRFALYSLRDRTFRSQLRRYVNQAVNQASVSIANLKNLELRLPTLVEQRRLVAILDKTDELRTKRRQALAHIDELAPAIFHDMFGDPTSNPFGLPCKPLTEIGHLYSGGTPSKADPENWDGKLPWFSPKDMKRNDLFDSVDHISEDYPARSSLKKLPKNTVAFVVRGMILAHTFPVSVIRVESTLNQDMKAVIAREPIDPDFLATCLRVQANRVLTLVDTAAHGTKKLDARALSNIQILVPDLGAQAEFAKRIAAVRRLRDYHRNQLDELDKLFASLQHRAFTGNLR